MPNRLMALVLLPAAGFALLVAATLDAAAQPTPAAQAVWERFVGICPAIAAANDPMAHAQDIENAQGGFVHSGDDRIRTASLDLTDLHSYGMPAMLIVAVDDYDGGRTVDCMLQLTGGAADLSGLTDLAGGDAARVLGDEVALVVAGGPLSAASADGGFVPMPGAAQAVRITPEGFPPQATLNVQVLPLLAVMRLHAVQEEPAD